MGGVKHAYITPYIGYMWAVSYAVQPIVIAYLEGSTICMREPASGSEECPLMDKIYSSPAQVNSVTAHISRCDVEAIITDPHAATHHPRPQLEM